MEGANAPTTSARASRNHEDFLSRTSSSANSSAKESVASSHQADCRRPKKRAARALPLRSASRIARVLRRSLKERNNSPKPLPPIISPCASLRTPTGQRVCAILVATTFVVAILFFLFFSGPPDQNVNIDDPNSDLYSSPFQEPKRLRRWRELDPPADVDTAVFLGHYDETVDRREFRPGFFEEVRDAQLAEIGGAGPRRLVGMYDPGGRTQLVAVDPDFAARLLALNAIQPPAWEFVVDHWREDCPYRLQFLEREKTAADVPSTSPLGLEGGTGAADSDTQVAGAAPSQAQYYVKACGLQFSFPKTCKFRTNKPKIRVVATADPLLWVHEQDLRRFYVRSGVVVGLVPRGGLAAVKDFDPVPASRIIEISAGSAMKVKDHLGTSDTTHSGLAYTISDAEHVRRKKLLIRAVTKDVGIDFPTISKTCTGTKCGDGPADGGGWLASDTARAEMRSYTGFPTWRRNVDAQAHNWNLLSSTESTQSPFQGFLEEVTCAAAPTAAHQVPGDRLPFKTSVVPLLPQQGLPLPRTFVDKRLNVPNRSKIFPHTMLIQPVGFGSAASNGGGEIRRDLFLRFVGHVRTFLDAFFGALLSVELGDYVDLDGVDVLREEDFPSHPHGIGSFGKRSGVKGAVHGPQFDWSTVLDRRAATELVDAGAAVPPASDEDAGKSGALGVLGKAGGGAKLNLSTSSNRILLRRGADHDPGTDDGNAFYRALAEQLRTRCIDASATHEDLRRRVAEKIRSADGPGGDGAGPHSDALFYAAMQRASDSIAFQLYWKKKLFQNRQSGRAAYADWVGSDGESVGEFDIGVVAAELYGAAGGGVQAIEVWRRRPKLFGVRRAEEARMEKTLKSGKGEILVRLENHERIAVYYGTSGLVPLDEEDRTGDHGTEEENAGSVVRLWFDESRSEWRSLYHCDLDDVRVLGKICGGAFPPTASVGGGAVSSVKNPLADSGLGESVRNSPSADFSGTRTSTSFLRKDSPPPPLLQPNPNLLSLSSRPPGKDDQLWFRTHGLLYLTDADTYFFDPSHAVSKTSLGTVARSAEAGEASAPRPPLSSPSPPLVEDDHFTDRIAGVSLARFYGRTKGSKLHFEAMLLARFVKLATHETAAQLFALGREVLFDCVTRGFRWTRELDDIHFDLGPVALRKLFYLVSFDAEKRYDLLIQWLDGVVLDAAKRSEAERQAYEDVFGGWRAWWKRRVKVIRRKR